MFVHFHLMLEIGDYILLKKIKKIDVGDDKDGRDRKNDKKPILKQL